MPRNKRIKIDAPFAACKETEKHYIFASYAHNNVKQVFPMLKNVYELGVNVWYDQGIEINSHYDDVIADRIANCDAFVLFLTNESVKRDYVIHNELQHARNNHKKVIVCRLENVHHIPKGVEMLLNNAESVSADDLVEKLKPYRSSPARVAQPISIKHSVDAPLPLQDYDCEYTSKGIILTRYKGNETDIVIPNQIDGYTVFGLKETFKNNRSIVSVSIPDTVKRIDYASFNHCRALETLKIPNSVTFIGRYAFADCNRLTIECEQGSAAHDYVQRNNMKYRLTQSNGGENKGNDYFKSTVSDAFVYAAYSHGDSETVMRILNKLNRDGCNIRYDEGITDNIDIYDDMVSCKAAIVFFSKISR